MAESLTCETRLLEFSGIFPHCVCSLVLRKGRLIGVHVHALKSEFKINRVDEDLKK